jgi:putative membrane protein
VCIETRQALGWWTADPVALGITTLASSVYLVGVRRLWRASPRGSGAGIPRWRALLFLTGQMTILIALISPIDRLSDLLFSAHMTQHELLMVVAPPLVVLGRPLVAALWALPDELRAHVTTSFVARPRWVGAYRALQAPLVGLIVHGATVWIWHVPELFEAGMRSESVHALQHASFFGSAALFWSAILQGRYGRAGYGAAALFVFVTAMHTSLLGVLLTLAARVWYPIYRARGGPWQVDAQEDQTLAGLVMWVPAGVAWTLAALALFFVWLNEASARVRRAERQRAAGRVRPA